MVLAYQPGGPGSNPARIIYFCHAFVHYFVTDFVRKSFLSHKHDKLGKKSCKWCIYSVKTEYVAVLFIE